VGNVKVDVDFSGINKTFSKGNTDYARYVMANQIHKDMEPFIPMESGDLRDISYLDENSNVNYTMPYASRLFYQQMTNYTTPGTGPRWDLVAKSLYISDWQKVYAKGLLKHGWN